MIINLDSIEEETLLEETGPLKEVDRNKSRDVMRKWDEELNFLEHKFKRV